MSLERHGGRTLPSPARMYRSFDSEAAGVTRGNGSGSSPSVPTGTSARATSTASPAPRTARRVRSTRLTRRQTPWRRARHDGPGRRLDGGEEDAHRLSLLRVRSGLASQSETRGLPPRLGDARVARPSSPLTQERSPRAAPFGGSAGATPQLVVGLGACALAAFAVGVVVGRGGDGPASAA